MKKGFTLIELLIVIGILAVLATVTVLVLNPAELFRQARDSQRISDLNSLKNAIALYLTVAPTPDLGALGFACGTKFGADVTGVTNPFTGDGSGLTQTVAASSTSLVTSGGGWLPVNFASMTGGSPLSVLPHDPSRTTTYFYAYACGTVGTANELTFEVDANMESSKYKAGGANDVEGNTIDGGNNANLLEVGTYQSLAL